MPVTPFHFGPGLLMKGLAARSFSLTAFVASNIVIDFESLYYLSRDEWPVHRKLHTFLGAGIVGVVVAVAMMAAAVLLPRRWRNGGTSVRQAEVSRVGIVTGAMMGALSHPLLDGIMHPDIEPFRPWSAENALRGMVSIASLHMGCMIMGVAGLVLLLVWKR